MNMTFTSLAWESSFNVSSVAAHTTCRCGKFQSSAGLSKGCHCHPPVTRRLDNSLTTTTCTDICTNKTLFNGTLKQPDEATYNSPRRPRHAGCSTFTVAVVPLSLVCFCSLQISQVTAESGPLVDYWSR